MINEDQLAQIEDANRALRAEGRPQEIREELVAEVRRLREALLEVASGKCVVRCIKCFANKVLDAQE